MSTIQVSSKYLQNESNLCDDVLIPASDSWLTVTEYNFKVTIFYTYTVPIIDIILIISSNRKLYSHT